MQIFIMHVGSPGNVDLDYTVARTRSVEEMLEKLPKSAPEREFFESDNFRKQFPTGVFNCWGLPIKAKSEFDKTEAGDLVLFIPEVGESGGVSYLGMIKAIYTEEAYQTSRVLWPDTPYERLFPWLFFFNTESGFLPWHDFLSELKISLNWNPRGWYRKIADERFNNWGGSEGYLHHLRDDLSFIYLNRMIELYEPEVDIAKEEIKAIIGKPVPRSSQGFLTSVKARKAIEEYAMKQAKIFLRERDWKVEDVSSNMPYDLSCTRKGSELFVEVKGTTTLGEQILLTRNEVQHAKDKYPNVALFIVSQLHVKSNDNDFEVSGGVLRFINPWSIREENLRPLSYSYDIL